MIISVNWLKKFTSIDMPVDELATLIGARLVEIEKVIDLGAKYKDVIVARVVVCHPLEASDHLNLTQLDDGGVTQGVERNDSGYIQVVCGAPNVKEGMLVAWLPPASTVPDSFETADPFVLSARKLRGAMSNGMIASAKELDLFDEHDGILELDTNLTPGASFASSYELDDYLFDIENKSLTHRPDTFGIIGFAREIAAIQGNQFETPSWLRDSTSFTPTDETVTAPTVTIDNAELSSRYQAILLARADGGVRSPLWLQTYLARVGVRPISAVVDVTNYLMMLTGQPLHAFDYDKLVAAGGGRADIHVRSGREGERLALLDGRTITLSQEDIVIATGETAIGLAGAMGGSETAIDDSTKTIILESATFDLYRLRSTQMRHGIFSEAITRFTKGQPAELTAPVLSQAVTLLSELTGAIPVSAIIENYPGYRKPVTIELSIESINQTLGSRLSISDAVQTLHNVEFPSAIVRDGVLTTEAPYWRSDIHIPEDIIEEVGRLNGFDTIKPTLPRRDFTAVRQSSYDELRSLLRKILARAGANEVLTYSFVHGDVLRKAGQIADDSYRIINSISPDLQYYRQTLTPSLLGLVHPNSKAGYDEFVLYEMNKAHNKRHPMTEENVPGELSLLALTIATKKPRDGAAYYAAKSYLEYLATSLGLSFSYSVIDHEPGYPVTAPFEYCRSAMVNDRASGEFIGIIGEYKKSVQRAFKLPEYSAGFEIDPEGLLDAVSQLKPAYTPISRYPSTERDICFQVASDEQYGRIIELVEGSLKQTDLETAVSPVDIFQAAEALTKNVTIRLKLTSHRRTLTGEEVASVIANVSRDVVREISAHVI
jgi:phenylalanyl-tRNA synthetase beta chain